MSDQGHSDVAPLLGPVSQCPTFSNDGLACQTFGAGHRVAGNPTRRPAREKENSTRGVLTSQPLWRARCRALVRPRSIRQSYACRQGSVKRLLKSTGIIHEFGRLKQACHWRVVVERGPGLGQGINPQDLPEEPALERPSLLRKELGGCAGTCRCRGELASPASAG